MKTAWMSPPAHLPWFLPVQRHRHGPQPRTNDGPVTGDTNRYLTHANRSAVEIPTQEKIEMLYH